MSFLFLLLIFRQTGQIGSKKEVVLVDNPNSAAIHMWSHDRGLPPGVSVEGVLYRANFEKRTLEEVRIPRISFGD
jgi:hypothetical protein